MKIGSVRYFASAGAFRKWLQKNHDRVDVLWVGYYKKASGRPSITYRESLDEALCFGWIDGVRKRIDEDRYTIRFTPRKPKSRWSQVNIRRAEALKASGAMAPPGLTAFDERDRRRAGYSFEERPQRLEPKLETVFKANPAAWKFFEAQPPGQRRTVIWWVMSAVRDETKLKRLTRLIEDAAQGRRHGLLTK